jgi:hypothetical protein
VVEFMLAKFADIPSVLLRTDIRAGGDYRDEPWNLMTSYFPGPPPWSCRVSTTTGPT